MANELPYFRFTVQAWQNGKIDIERYELKGFFITVCGYYWIQDCSITLALLKKKFHRDLPLINELIEAEIIKVNRYDNVEISFLNTQYDLLSEKRKLRQRAGSKGGNAKAMLKQKGSYKDKDKDKEKDNNKDKDKKEIFNFKNSLLEYGFKENLVNDWLLVRKKKKATNTETAFKKFIDEVETRGGVNINEILENCVEKSWSGFKWEWIDNLTNKNGKGNTNSNKTGIDRVVELAKQVHSGNNGSYG